MNYFDINWNQVENFDNSATAYVLITKGEYLGLATAAKIVRRRALQEVKQSQCDKYGYKLLRADYKRYNDSALKAWRISKSTPYAVNIRIKDAKNLILNDLFEFYNYSERVGENNEPVSGDTYLMFHNTYQKHLEKPSVLSRIEANEISNYIIALQELDKHDGIVSFDLCKISCNYGSGLYEISYWATDVI